MSKLILASSSPRRQQILKDLCLQFEAFLVDFVEKMEGMEPKELVTYNALGKARTLVKAQKDGLEELKQKMLDTKLSKALTLAGIYIGCDTVIVLNGEILGKPNTPERAKSMLKKLSGKYHSVFSGLALIDAKTNGEMVGYEETKIKFRELSEEEIDDYIASEEPLDKAGAYGIQGRGELFVEKIEGSVSNVIGLPKRLLIKFLSECGIEIGATVSIEE